MMSRWLKKLAQLGIEIAAPPLAWGVYWPFYGLRVPELLLAQYFGSDE